MPLKQKGGHISQEFGKKLGVEQMRCGFSKLCSVVFLKIHQYPHCPQSQRSHLGQLDRNNQIMVIYIIF